MFRFLPSVFGLIPCFDNKTELRNVDSTLQTVISLVVSGCESCHI